MSGAVVIDAALSSRKDPIRVALVGTGFMGRAILWTLLESDVNIQVVAVVNRTLANAINVIEKAIAHPSSKKVSMKVVEKYEKESEEEKVGVVVISSDIGFAVSNPRVECVVECTGTIEFAAQVNCKAIDNGKHVVAMNAEIDATLGTALRNRADKKGVVFTQCDGDQPGVIMNLIRHAKSLGMEPVLAGNMKGFHNVYATPATQQWFADKFGQKSPMVTSFCDGSKVSFEMATVANATGMRVAKRGMNGTRCSKVSDAQSVLPQEALSLPDGCVDYILGAEPGPGVFVLAKLRDERHASYLRYYKQGEGPLYTLYSPYHLCHLEAVNSIARAVLFNDHVCSARPNVSPVVEVITVAKQDLSPGEALDGIGMFTTYGLCENSDIARSQRLLPLGLAEKCVLKREVKKDQAISFDDVDLEMMVKERGGELPIHFTLWLDQFGLSESYYFKAEVKEVKERRGEC